MQQRQLRLGDILDDYCPRERRVTNHVIVAMVGSEVKHTRCSTCDADHEYKHAKVPRQRRKSETPAVLLPHGAATPKRVAHEAPVVLEADADLDEPQGPSLSAEVPSENVEHQDHEQQDHEDEHDERVAVNATDATEEGPVHRQLIRATLPRQEGQQPPSRPAPDFTIRQPPGPGRPGRFRPRHQRTGQPFGDGANGNMSGRPGRPGGQNGGMRSGMPRQGSGRPPQGPLGSRLGRRDGPGRKHHK